MQRLFLTLVTLYVVTLTYADHQYLNCQVSKTPLHPSVCDCTDSKVSTDGCLINLTITGNSDAEKSKRAFHINGGKIGPTIIVKYGQFVVVDVYNNITGSNGNTSIHWHGMHQWNMGSMDGVGMITQWPTKPNDTFRHAFYARPSGTHWYHSHVGDQREYGIVGAFIVKEKTTSDMLKNIIDEPAKRILAISDHHVRSKTAVPECEPDGSDIPLDPRHVSGIESSLEPFKINGMKLASKREPPIEYLTFHVESSKKYRFRIVGIMSSEVIRFSIFNHTLNVISADGYLTVPYEVDILVVHVGERYDFILETKNKCKLQDENVFPIQIETVAVKCSSQTPSKISYAFLQYDKVAEVYKNQKPCGGRECRILNCPFKKYADKSDYSCHNVRELQLLNATPEDRLPTGKLVEYFFNFGFRDNTSASVNNVSNALPANIPFTHPRNMGHVTNQCNYSDKTNDKCVGKCAHVVNLKYKPKQNSEGSLDRVRFVLSSITKGEYKVHPNNITTHPIHLHGHSFFVAKIGYPTYHSNGLIKEENQDLNISECGPGKWTKTGSEQAQLISVNATTVRKDVIIVPAGGYVVIEFLADNPGWWFMHCHIDPHLNRGMAIVVNELPQCSMDPTEKLSDVKRPYEDARGLFWFALLLQQINCQIKRGYDLLEEECDLYIEREKNQDEIDLYRVCKIISIVSKNRDNKFVSLYYKRLLHQRFRARAADTEHRQFQDVRRRNEHAPEWDELDEQIEESIQRGRNKEYM